MSEEMRQNEEQNQLVEQKPAKKKMKNRGAPPPQVRYGFGETPEDKALIGRLLAEALEAYNMPKVQNDEQLLERFNEYFQRCAANGIIPTVEEMYMYTGYGVSYCFDVLHGVQNGFSTATPAILKKAKDFLKEYDAKLVLSGKVNPIVYFFRAKNYYDMADKQEVVVTPNTSNLEEVDATGIAERYLNDPNVIIVDDENGAESN